MLRSKSSKLVSRFKLMWLDMNICPDDDFISWTTLHLDLLSEMDTNEDESLSELLRSLKTLDINNRIKFTRQAKSLMKKYLTEYCSLENESLLYNLADACRVFKNVHVAIRHVAENLNHSLEMNQESYRTANLMINWGHDCREEYRAASDAIERDTAKLVVLDNLSALVEQHNRSGINITDIGVMLMTIEWGNIITLEQKRKCVRLLLGEYKNKKEGVVA